MTAPLIPPLTPSRKRWGRYWDPATGRTVWGCVGPGCPIRQTTLGLGQEEMAPETRSLFMKLGLGGALVLAASFYAGYRLVKWEESR